MQVVVPYYGKVWYDDNGIANIFSLTNFFNKFRVAYDSHQDYAFNVHTNRGRIKFIINKQGIYVYNPTYITEKSNVVTTVEENMVVFTSIQIERAK